MASPDEQSPPSKPVYQTDIANTPLPEILVTIHRYKAPGAIDIARNLLRPGDCILVKGSRAAGLEIVAEALVTVAA